jgi:putative nucleotide binding protein
MPQTHNKKYEEFAYVLDYRTNSRSSIIKGRDGTIIQAIGMERLTLLELLGNEDETFSITEKLSIGKEGRSKILSVLGKLSYDKLTTESVTSVSDILELIVNDNESYYINYFNNAHAVTPRLHSLEMIPGIGKTFLSQILKEREKSPFTSFSDISARINLKEPELLIAKRLMEEISGNAKLNLFVRN